MQAGNQFELHESQFNGAAAILAQFSGKQRLPGELQPGCLPYLK
jgi:hypothetical protein